MRGLPLKQHFAESGAVFGERFGSEIVTRVNEREKEYRTIREAAGVTDFSFMQKFRVPEETGLDYLDSILAGNVAKTRFGRVLHTFLPDASGNLLADCYVANNDEELIVLCESITDDATIRSLMTANPDAGVEDLTESHVVISIDGVQAWSVVKRLFGADVLGLPYLSIEMYPFENEQIRLFRAGKTSEFGYLLMVPASIGPALLAKVSEGAKACGGGLCGVEIHDELRLEGRFFNIFAEGARVGDPLSLGLQWMIDFDKTAFPGREQLLQRRADGLKKKIIGISAGTGSREIPIGAPVYHGDRQVASVEACCFSYILDSALGLALFDIDMAYAGLTFNLGTPTGPVISTISMPPIMPGSLTVKLDEM